MSFPSQKLLITTLYSSFKWLYPKKLVSLSNCIAITQINYHCSDEYDQILFLLMAKDIWVLRLVIEIILQLMSLSRFRLGAMM